MKNIYKPITLAFALVSAGCRGNNDSAPKSESASGRFKVVQENMQLASGYDVMLSYLDPMDAFGMRPGQIGSYILRIGTLNDSPLSGFNSDSSLIYAMDKDHDGRPDHIELIRVQRNSELEGLSTQKLAEIEQALLAQRGVRTQ